MGISSGWVKRALVATNFGGSVVPMDNSSFPAIAAATREGRLVPLADTSRPFFHNDVEDAVAAAERTLRKANDADQGSLSNASSNSSEQSRTGGSKPMGRNNIESDLESSTVIIEDV